MSKPKRRAFLTTPNEPLLLTHDPLEYLRRFDQFITVSGLEPERVLALPLLAVPLPVARRGEDGRPQRWSNANPEFMWHPLMWMPRHLALRYRFRTITDAAGGSPDDYDVESDPLWAIRVALELAASGLYDQDTGTWLDVLHLHGIDLDDVGALDRVQAWLDGGSDAVLDAIDLTSMMPGAANPDATVQTAAELAAMLVPAQWSITASGILDVVVDRAQLELSERSVDNGSLLSLVHVMGQVAAKALHGMPPDPELGTDIVNEIGVVAEAAAHPDSDGEVLVAALAELLSRVADDHASAIAELNARAAE